MLDLVLYGKEEGMIVEDYSENRQKPRRIIHPQKASTKGDFEVIKQFSKDNDIVQFEKKWFRKKVSCILYDDYNYDFDYVIITNDYNIDVVTEWQPEITILPIQKNT